MTSLAGCASALPSFKVLNAALRSGTCQIGAAESHGLLCGMLCGRGQFDEEQWLARVLGDDESDERVDGPCRTVLKQLELATVCQLQAADFSFQILLPPDSEALALRSRSVAAWCTGFLAGVGLVGGAHSRALTRDSREILRDMAEMTLVDVVSCVDREEENANEAAYAEIVEYLRVATLIIREEFHDSNSSPFAEQGCH